MNSKNIRRRRGEGGRYWITRTVLCPLFSMISLFVLSAVFIVHRKLSFPLIPSNKTGVQTPFTTILEGILLSLYVYLHTHYC